MRYWRDHSAVLKGWQGGKTCALFEPSDLSAPFGRPRPLSTVPPLFLVYAWESVADRTEQFGVGKLDSQNGRLRNIIPSLHGAANPNGMNG